MTTSAGMPDGHRRAGLVRALDAVRGTARAHVDELLGSVPDTGDPVTGRAVDDFVEQAADALRALDETLSRTLTRVAGEEAARPDLSDTAAAPERP